MKRIIFFVVPMLGLAVAGLALSGVLHNIRETLSGYEEVPAISTAGSGTFAARISKDETSVDYSLSYSDTESNVTQAHIHFGQKGVNGGISVFLCSNLGNGPAGTQPCPAAPATISGTFDADDVIGPAGQGIASGQFEELIRAMKAGVTYVNVHTVDRPGGEIRSQIDLNERRDH